MLAKYIVATAVGISALAGPGLVTQPRAAISSRLLLVRPGTGIGPVRIGETLGTLKEQFPHLAVRFGNFSLRLRGNPIKGQLHADRVAFVHSTTSNLVLSGIRLRNETSATQRLVNSGWTASTCLAGHPLVYRRDTDTHLVTVIAWGDPGVPPIALIQPGISPTWTHC